MGGKKRKLEHYFRLFAIQFIEVQKEEQRKVRAGNCQRSSMENFLELKDTSFCIMNKKRSIPRHIIMKFLKFCRGGGGGETPNTSRIEN